MRFHDVRSLGISRWMCAAVAVAVQPARRRGAARGQEPREWKLSDAHSGTIIRLAFSPDGKTLATSSVDGSIKLWDVATSEVRSTLVAYTLPKSQRRALASWIAFSPDGTTLVSASGARTEAADLQPGTIKPGSVVLWDTATGQRRSTLGMPPQFVAPLAYSRDGATLALLVGEGVLSLWDVVGDRQRAEIQADPGGRIAFSADLGTVAFVAGPNTIHLVNTTTRRWLATLNGHKNRIETLAISADGKTLASGAGRPSAFSGGHGQRTPGEMPPSEVKLWDLTADPPRERASLMGMEHEIGAIAFSADGRLVAATGRGGLRVWDAATGAAVAALSEWGMGSYDAVTFSPDGRLLAAARGGLGVDFWETREWRRRGGLEGRTAERVAFTPDGRTLAAGLSDGTVALRDVASGRVRMMLHEHTGAVTALAVSRDGKKLAAGAVDGAIVIWDPSTGDRRVAFPYSHPGSVTALAFSPDGRVVASGGKDLIVRLWDIPSVRPMAAFQGHSREVTGLAFATDGATLVSTSLDGTIRYWDVAGKREKSVVRGHTVRVARMKERTMTVNGETVRGEQSVPGEWTDMEVPIRCLASSPDGRTLATGDRAFLRTGGVSVRDAATGKERVAFEMPTDRRHGPGEDINALAFSPDGRILAAAAEGTIRLSDAATGKELAVLKAGRTSPVRDLAFSPDGKTLVSGGSRAALLWDVAAAVAKAKP